MFLHSFACITDIWCGPLAGADVLMPWPAVTWPISSWALRPSQGCCASMASTSLDSNLTLEAQGSTRQLAGLTHVLASLYGTQTHTSHCRMQACTITGCWEPSQGHTSCMALNRRLYWWKQWPDNRDYSEVADGLAQTVTECVTSWCPWWPWIIRMLSRSSTKAQTTSDRGCCRKIQVSKSVMLMTH